MKILRNSRAWLLCAVIGAMAGTLYRPQPVQSAVLSGLRLCAFIVVPSLFPFLVFSSFFCLSGLADVLGKRLSPITQRLFALPPCGGSVFLLGILSGYPVGAASAAQLYGTGACSRQAAHRMLAFCNNSGPAFVVGAVGIGMFGSARLGWLLYLVHLASALLCGLLLRLGRRVEAGAPVRNIDSPPVAAAFVSAVQSSVEQMLNICGFILFFQILRCLVETSGLMNWFCEILCRLCPILQPDALSALLLGTLELTSGLRDLSVLGPTPLTLILAEILLSSGGICVYAQVASVIEGSGLSMADYRTGKLLAAGLSGLIMSLLLLCRPQLLSVFAGGAAAMTLPWLGAVPLICCSLGGLALLPTLFHRNPSLFSCKKSRH